MPCLSNVFVNLNKKTCVLYTPIKLPNSYEKKIIDKQHCKLLIIYNINK